jgi:hypothetical protein
MTQREGNPLLRTEISQPVPGEDTFAADDHILPVGCNGLEKGFGGCLHSPVDKNLRIPIQNTDVHGPGVQVNATVKLVLCGVEALEVLCRGTRRPRAAGVKRLHPSTTPWAAPRPQESTAGDTRGDWPGSGHDTSAAPVVGR